MSNASEWKNFWEAKSSPDVSDYEFDRGAHRRESEIEDLSNRELLHFVEPRSHEVIFDAGCGTGVNILLLHSRVKKIVGMDYSEGALGRCRKRILSKKIGNVELMQGEIMNVPLPDRSVDKILCMSVLQYLDDAEVRRTFKEFARLLKSHGEVILHVKNIASLYLSTLWLAKRLKLLLGGKPKLENFRSFRWYIKELESAGFQVVLYNSFNLFMIESMPGGLIRFFQRLELRHHKKFPLRIGFLRRHGSDLKIKAGITKMA